MSDWLLVSPGTRLDDRLEKATNLPSALIAVSDEKLLACVPSPAIDTRSVVSVSRSRTNMSDWLLVSSGTRFDPELANATYLASALIEGDDDEVKMPVSLPSLATETRSV